MKRSFSVIFAAVVFVLATLTSALADKPDFQFMAKQWEQRHNYIEAANNWVYAVDMTDNLNKKADLYYQAARCYLKVGNLDSANIAIERMQKYNAGSGNLAKLAPFFKEAGWKAAKQYKNDVAYQAFSQYLGAHPGESKKLADDLYAKNYKDLAYQINPSLKNFDCKAMMVKADKATDDNEMFQGYSNLVSNCPVSVMSFEDQQRIGRKILDLAKRDAKNPNRDAQTKEEKRIAGLFISDDAVEAELPDKKVFTPGSYQFHILPGEQTEFWIEFPYGVITVFNTKPDDDGYFFKFEDGEMASGLEGPKDRDRYRFKLLALKEFEFITLNVRNK